jgi:hypothetical protein
MGWNGLGGGGYHRRNSKRKRDEQRRGRIWWNHHFDLKGLSKARQLSLIAFGSHAPHIASCWWARGSNKNEIEHLETKQEIVRIHLYKTIFMETVTYIILDDPQPLSVYRRRLIIYLNFSVRRTLDAGLLQCTINCWRSLNSPLGI